MNGDDRTRTGALSPDKRALSSSELRPQGLLRVARVGFEPTSRAHEAREDNHSSTALQAGVASDAAVWPAGVEPAVSGSRSRRGGRLPYDQKANRAPAAGLEPALPRLQSRVRTRSTTPERRRKERESNPQGREAHPFSGRDTAPGGSPSERVSGPGRRRTCNLPVKSRLLCRVELRSPDVTGRDRTCDAPRFRRALYPLSYGHVR
jgi:hypothetical protein